MFSEGFSLGNVLIQYVCLLFSLCVHEAAHALMANRCGDPSARLMGRATLNPLAHIDPLGTVILPLLMMVSNVPFMFGWAKPVPFNPRNLRNMRRDPALIGLAGPAANVLTAITFALILRIIVVTSDLAPGSEVLDGLTHFVITMVVINLVLAVFNMIPVPPLDGHHLLYPLLGPGGQRMMEQIGPFGILIAIIIARPIVTPIVLVLLEIVRVFVFWGRI